LYQLHTFVASTCVHVICSGDFRFGDDFEYTYLSKSLVWTRKCKVG
jgi:hypothetical protein